MENSPRTAPDFSRPIAALKACHERLRSQCAALRELVGNVRDLGSDAQSQQAAAGVMRYFDTAARHHHADEEEDLLPRMVAAASMGRGLRLTRLVADSRADVRAEAATSIAELGTPSILNSCASALPDSFQDVLLTFDQNQVAAGLLLDLEPSDAVVVVKITGKNANGQNFKGFDLLRVLHLTTPTPSSGPPPPQPPKPSLK